MPLRDNCDKEERQQTISYNIRELISAWESSGEINGDKIRSRKEALSRATAVALSICRKPTNKKEE